MTTAWTFALLDGSETYSFPINPNEHANLVPSRDIQWVHSRDGFSGQRAGRQPLRSSFSGVERSQAQYQAFLTWVGKKTKIRLTTDLGQRYVIRLMQFKPAQRGQVRNQHAPWRHTYVMDILIFETESVL